MKGLAAASVAARFPGRDAMADAIIVRHCDAGARHGMAVVGHTLVWHFQTPRWVFADAGGRPASRDMLPARLRDHIFTGLPVARESGIANRSRRDDAAWHAPVQWERAQ